jgi:uncharacterized membrane protein
MNLTRYNKAIAAALVPIAIVLSGYLTTGHVAQDQVVAALIALGGVVAVYLAPKNAEPTVKPVQG